MVESQFKRYTTLLTFATDWRKYKLELKPLTEAAFRTEMQTTQYVTIECLNTVQKRKVLIYLFDKNTKYTNSSQDLKKLLNKIKNPCDIILVTYTALSSYCKRVVNLFKHLNVVTYRHEIFDLVLPYGPLCYPHRIMSREEVLKLCNQDLYCYLVNLPKIFKEDPQCIWIGANVGDVIEITAYSDIVGFTTQYRVVISKNNRIIAIKESNSDDVADAADTADAVSDDEREYTEQIKSDDELSSDGEEEPQSEIED